MPLPSGAGSTCYGALVRKLHALLATAEGAPLTGGAAAQAERGARGGTARMGGGEGAGGARLVLSCCEHWRLPAGSLHNPTIDSQQ
jgi:hypothetical protein